MRLYEINTNPQPGGGHCVLCGGGIRFVIDTDKEPVFRIDKEAMAIALCHYDGWDYGEPYDQWPDTILDDSGAPWDDQEEAKSDYRDRVGSMLRAGLVEFGGDE